MPAQPEAVLADQRKRRKWFGMSGEPNFRELEPDGGLAQGSRLLQADRLNRQVVDCRPAVIGDPDLAAVVRAEADLVLALNGKAGVDHQLSDLALAVPHLAQHFACVLAEERRPPASHGRRRRHLDRRPQRLERT